MKEARRYRHVLRIPAEIQGPDYGQPDALGQLTRLSSRRSDEKRQVPPQPTTHNPSGKSHPILACDIPLTSVPSVPYLAEPSRCTLLPCLFSPAQLLNDGGSNRHGQHLASRRALIPVMLLLEQ